MRKFGAFTKKQLDLYLCKGQKIMVKVIMASVTIMTSVIMASAIMAIVIMASVTIMASVNYGKC